MRFAYTRPDGGVSIVTAAPKEHLERVLGKLTDAQHKAHVIARSIPPDATNVTEISDIPSDRTFRDAWKQNGSSIEHDMDKARAIHRDRLRQARAPKMSVLDVEYQRADEAGDAEKKKSVAAAKQELRDVTKHPGIDAAQTVDELKAVWPEALS